MGDGIGILIGKLIGGIGLFFIGRFDCNRIFTRSTAKVLYCCIVAGTYLLVLQVNTWVL